MTTPAAPKETPTDGDMIEATFRALAGLVPGAQASRPENREADTLTRLAHFGAAETDLAVIRDWLEARHATRL